MIAEGLAPVLPCLLERLWDQFAALRPEHVGGCSDRTIRRRLAHWSALGISEQLHALALVAYDRQ